MAAYYVSSKAIDGGTGTKAEPFRTMGAALAAVRKSKQRGREPVAVLLREGTHYLDAPIVIGADCSGSAGAPVTVTAFEGEKATISGGKRLTCKWQPYRNGIMVCSLPQVKAGKLGFTQLFVNGKRQTRARYPNIDPDDPLKGYATAKGHFIERLPKDETTDRMAWIRNRSEGARGILFDPSTFSPRKWSKPDRAVLHIFPANRNANLQWRIKGLDPAKGIMWLGWGGFQRNTKMFPHGYDDIDSTSRFFVENVFEELDAPGEWYLDEDEGKLYCMPEDGTDLSKAEVVVPLLKQVVEFRGTQSDPVRHVTVSGVRVAHTTSTFLEPYEFLSGGDWSIHRGGAVFLEGTEACTVERCFFDAVGGNALFVNNYNLEVKILGNEFSGAGDSAVCLVGSDHLTLDGIDMYPAGCVVSNNQIHDCGILGKQIAGVFSAVSRGNTISHNEIHRLPRAGICLNDGIYGGHIVEYNKVYDMVRET